VIGRLTSPRAPVAARLALTAQALLAGVSSGSIVAAPGTAGEAEILTLASDLRLVVQNGRDVELELRASAGDDWATLARRATGGSVAGAELERSNSSVALTAGAWIRVPVARLRPELRSIALRNLFPLDRHEGQDWIHVARSGALPTYDEGLWQVAEWFTGDGETFGRLMAANGLSSPELREGQELRVPAEILHPAFRARPRSDDGALEYGSDADGSFAAYRLKRGEALYSAVVLRFTGRTAADDVQETAEQLLARSALADARDIPVASEIKIPLDLLEPEHLPPDHPRRRAVEQKRAEMNAALAEQPVAGTRGGLQGVVVIIDPGHGGVDLGTLNHGIWEHDYVYDVACRLKFALETETAARVVMTLEDRETGCLPSTADRLVANKQGTILTSPTFLATKNGDSEIGVNLRWYLANSVYRQAVAGGAGEDRVVFLSLHADSRHPGLRGLMVYVPGADLRAKTHGSTSSTYGKFKEVREQPTIRFTKNERVRSEAVSRKLAQSIVTSFRRSGLPVQPYQPVRDKVLRGKQKWLPAVLRGNAVPAKVLVEILNLANAEDARLLAEARRREQVARSLQAALFDHFGEESGGGVATRAAP